MYSLSFVSFVFVNILGLLEALASVCVAVAVDNDVESSNGEDHFEVAARFGHWDVLRVLVAKL